MNRDALVPVRHQLPGAQPSAQILGIDGGTRVRARLANSCLASCCYSLSVLQRYLRLAGAAGEIPADAEALDEKVATLHAMFRE
ncbi:MAG: hypothetical protein ACK41V_05735 [Acidovorax sp.]|uniref:hypothetical protein n=1 Tax=Acidovorax sp. TaxID=1872122 RepID=UPI003918947D